MTDLNEMTPAQLRERAMMAGLRVLVVVSAVAAVVSLVSAAFQFGRLYGVMQATGGW